MEERSLRVYNGEKTFFSKITTTITKLLIPTKVGINGMLISMKRNNVLKAYENFTASNELEDANKKEQAQRKYEDTFALYLEAIDKYIMDSIYKKVKNGTATDFEKNALSKYYVVIHLKETEFLEYKYQKQKYLLDLDYETIQELEKPKLIERYNDFYVSKMDSLFKGLLKNYSIKLSDNIGQTDKEKVYEKIFESLELYISNILPLKIKKDTTNTYKEILEEYDKFDRFTVGKLDQRDYIEKRMILLGISRKLFTHSLPLVVAEQCYIKLLKDTRSLIVDTKILKKQQGAYNLLIDLIEDYNIKLLSTKVYWDKPGAREEYKKFWDEYKTLDKKSKDYQKNKEILFVRNDLIKVQQNPNKYYKIIKFYKNKLVEYGAMKELKNSYTSSGTYSKKKVTIPEE